MIRAKRLTPLPILALVLLALGCAVPLPAPQLTATAESQLPAPVQDRSGSEVQSASSGAPSNNPLSLQQTANDDKQPSALAALEDDELAGTTVVPDEDPVEATPEPQGFGDEAAADPTETPTPEEPTLEVDGDATDEAALAMLPSEYPQEMVALLNQFRIAKGIPELQFDATLTASAMGYAQYMATTNFFGHYPPSGSTPSGRIAATGFEGQYQGEALSAGQPTPAVALSRLLGSSDHAAILLNASSTLVGVGYYYEPGSQYGHYWAVVTANP
jgi:uncharacterized protein YkwD